MYASHEYMCWPHNIAILRYASQQESSTKVHNTWYNQDCLSSDGYKLALVTGTQSERDVVTSAAVFKGLTLLMPTIFIGVS